MILSVLPLYSLGIIHRDIKPENVLVVNNTNPVIAKLLDFGLSKHANLGSMAKTFVGTPCYLAPEVELTAMGKGGTYGPAADCWGLGAVLYVMLVARFPEFDRDHGIVRLRLPDALWRNKSRDVKDLISSLMTHDPVRRLTARLALQHVWLAEFREEDRNLPFPKPLPAAASTLANGKRVDYLGTTMSYALPCFRYTCEHKSVSILYYLPDVACHIFICFISFSHCIYANTPNKVM